MTSQEFFTKNAPHLTSQQRAAVEATDGAVLVLAVPGSGKTTALIARLGYMLLVRGIEPEKLLTMTYTVAATEEMRGRFRTLFGDDYAGRLEFRTINGISAKIIAYYSRSLGKSAAFSLMDNEGDRISIVRRLYSELTGEYGDDGTIRELLTAITYVKNMMLTDEEIASFNSPMQDFPKLYSRYCEELKKRRVMDYDDQMSYAYAILRRYPEVLSFFQDKYPYLSVDEAQDTSKIQHAIIALLAQKYGNIFMVGDEDQSIYGFRAAYPEALMEFTETYSGAKILKMEDNFRSTDEIVSAANRFISQNRNRYEKTMHPTRSAHREISIIKATDRKAQYRFMFEKARRNSGECAILYRNNESALPLIDLMERANVPYSCRRFDDSFFTCKVVSDVTDIINFAFNPTDTEIFLRIYYKLGTMMTKEQAKQAAESAKRNNISVLNAALKSCKLSKYAADAVSELISDLNELKICSATTAMLLIRLRLGYGQYAERSGLDPGKLDILSMIAAYQKDSLALLRRLEELRLLISNHENSAGGIMLSTIHSAKGLEFEKVNIIDVIDGLLPSVAVAKDEKLYEEERRLFYVAMTRARDELSLYSLAFPSEFVSEVESALPREVFKNNDALAGALVNRVGKRYSHRELGEGVIIAQCEDDYLIEFSGGKTAFLTFSEMLANREKTFVAPKAEAPKKQIKKISVEDFKPGVKVSHVAFGDGVVMGMSEGIAAIKFFSDDTTRRIGLDLCVKNGILSVK